MIKKIFAIAISAICIFTSAVMLSSSVFAMIGDDGYAVPASSGILQTLSKREGDPVALVPVTHDDTVYKKALGYFVGEDRDEIDVTFPLYVNGGVGLRFLREDNWLITPDVDVYQTFDGLYVNEGVSYNSDMSRADEEEFIFLMLSNGLYMNVQEAVLENRLGTVFIPTNSVIMMTKDAICWMQYNNGTLSLHVEEAVFDAMITIGGVTYDYFDLLKALGLVKEAIEQGEMNRPDEEILEEAAGTLKPNEKGDGVPEQSGENNQPETDAPTEDGASEPGQSGDQPKQEAAGDTEDKTHEGDRDNQGEETPGEPAGDEGAGSTAAEGSQGAGGFAGTGGGGAYSGGGSYGDTGDDFSEMEGDLDKPDEGGNTDADNSGLADALIQFTAQKLFEGLPAAGSEFTFILRDSAGRVIETVTNFDEEIAFEPISIGKEGTYIYTITEEKGDNANVSYDTVCYTATVVITKGTEAYIPQVSYQKDGAAYEGTLIFSNELMKPEENTPGVGDDDMGGGEDMPILPGETEEPEDGMSGTPGEGESSDGEEGEDGLPGENDKEEEGVPGEEGEKKDPIKLPYQKPEVSISNFNPWSYAIDMDLKVKDRSSTITRGIKFAVYNKLKGSGAASTDEQGNKVYPSDRYEGQNLMLRTTRTGTQEMSLNPLKPGETVYIQFSYRYYEEEKEMQEVQVIDPVTGNGVVDADGNPVTELQEVTVRKRKYFYSDYVEVKLPSIEESLANGDLHAVALDWETRFAAYADAIDLTNIRMDNTSAYDEKKAETTYDFVNFKLNTLPYVNRMEIELTPVEGGETVTLAVNNTILNRAKNEGVEFHSTNPKLESNTQYKAVVKLKDRYGNDLPMIANGTDSGSYSEIVYTQKLRPSVSIEETLNVTDSLTVKLVVSDPDGALSTGESLYYTMSNDGAATILYGHWKDGSALGSDTAKRIELKDAKDGKKYEFTLESLAFARLFDAEVRGDYSPSPDGVTTPSLEEEKDVLLGQAQIYTASLTEGIIGFTTNFTDVLDTSVTINATMNNATTMEILPLVDEYRVYLTDKNGAVVRDKKTVLKESELNSPNYVYDQSTIVLDAGNDLNPKVYLYGTADQVRSTTWDSFCIGQIPGKDTEGNDILVDTNPMQLRVELPKDYLVNFNRYTLYIEAVVIKGGEEYYIPVSVTNNKITTKKTIPVIQYEDLFVASDVAQFVDLHVLDPDATIQNGGKIIANLYYGKTHLAVQEFYADQTANGSGPKMDLTFDGLIEDGDYTITFVAEAYNDEEGYGAYRQNYLLATYNIKGGSDLTGKLNLTALQVDTVNAAEDVMTAEDAVVYPKSLIINWNVSGYGSLRGMVPYTSGWSTIAFPCEPNTIYEVTYDNPIAKTVYYGSVEGTAEDLKRVSDTKTVYGDIAVSTNATAKSTIGQSSLRITTASQDSFIVIGCETSRVDTFIQSLTVRKYNETSPTNRYKADVHAQVSDYKGYLARDLAAGETPYVTLKLESSESMTIPEYKDYASYELPLVKDAADSTGKGWILDTTKMIDNLEPNRGWRATLLADYQGREIKLDEITFRTDATYISVSNHQQLYDAARANPYANILVTDDFVQNVDNYFNFYGTIDFQGHVVTKSKDITTHFIYYLYEGASVRNLVYDYPAESYYKAVGSIVHVNYGTIENLIIRTYGQVEFVGYAKTIYQIAESGVLRNFIIRLGGDMLLNNTDSNQRGALIASSVTGIVENGYVYGVNGAGLLQIGTAHSALFGSLSANASVRNVYSLLDVWQRVDENGIPFENNHHLVAWSRAFNNAVQNVYTVGEYYSMGSDLKKSYLLPLGSPNYFCTDTMALDNVWCITATENLTPRNVQHIAGIDKLFDTEWQKSTLGDGFDVEGCVSVGFYPRLYLPTEMQKYQEYLPLPVQAVSNTPSIVSDGWADEAQYGAPGLTEGVIRLRMKNDINATIAGVKFEHLIVVGDRILEQKMADDGLYDVILRVAVDSNSEEYVSSYQVTEIVYNVGAVQRSAVTDYDTVNIEFWKEIRDVDGWNAINDHLGWNYKITKDINFADAKPGQIIINGRRDNFDYASSTQSVFAGKLDGQEHVLSGISLQNLSTPYVFYYANNGAQIKNLLIENMTISSARTPNQEYAGFIRYASKTTIENVHIRNSSMTGGGIMGILVGNLYTYSLMEGCSVTDSTLTDIEAGYSVDAGALAGIVNSGTRVMHCYTRDVAIVVENSNATRSVGGLIGFTGAALMKDCYSHGTITTSSSNVGGIYGLKTSGDGAYLLQSIAYVDILQVSGNFAGGLVGSGQRAYNCIVLGNVNGAGADTYRIGSGTGSGSTMYAWNGQQAASLTEKEPGDADALLTGEELSRTSIWQDVVALGEEWDYTPVAQGFLPMLSAKYDCAREGWQQQPIPLPGQSTDPTLQLVSADYAENPRDGYKYSVTVRLNHPKSTTEEIAGYYQNPATPDKKLKITINGMDLSDLALSTDKAKITLESQANGSSTLIQVQTADFELALDSYLMTVSYNDGVARELSTMVTYMEAGVAHINWLTISNIDEWNSAMPEHGTTEENIRITGIIDFARSNTEYRGLKFNRLSGIDPATSGFINLRYAGQLLGESWVDKVNMELSNLSFKEMVFNYEIVDTKRTRTGPFQAVYNASNLVLENINIIGVSNSAGYLGFISGSTGEIKDVTMTNVDINANYTGGSIRSYVGALVGRTSGDVSNIKAKDITVNAPRCSYVGGIVGHADTWGKDTSSMTMEGVQVTGYSYVGGLMGYSLGGADGSTVTGLATGNMNKVESKSYGAGGVAGYLGDIDYSNGYKNVKVVDMTISATTYMAGGVGGYFSHATVQDVEVRNCKITAGTSRAGGLVGSNSSTDSYSNATSLYRNIQIVDCDIKAGTDYAGGILGFGQSDSNSISMYGIVIRNTDISGANHVGGLVGWLDRTGSTAPIIDRVYIAEDVTVSGDVNNGGRYVGGLVGCTNIYKISNAICGATVSGSESVGGAIGQIDLRVDSSLAVTMENVMYLGEVSATIDYAGGLVGKLNATSAEFNDDTLKNCVVAASVTTQGLKASLWVNDTASSGSAGRGTVYVYENSVLNGQNAKELHDAATTIAQQLFVVPDTNTGVKLMVDSAKLANPDFYEKELKLSTVRWDWSHLSNADNVYMPYTKNYVTASTSDGVLYYVNKDSTTPAQTVGILIPQAASYTGSQLTVYPSGINTINIEAPVPKDATGTTVTLTADGQNYSYTTNEYGVATVKYDYQTDFAVSTAATPTVAVSYDADDLNRQVMTYGNYWYYLKDGKIHYGSAVGSNLLETGTVKSPEDSTSDITNAIHLWQGKVLLADGTSYDISGANLINKVSFSGNLEAANLKPFWSDSTVQVYNGYSIVTEHYLPYRVFMLEKVPYTVSVAQDAVHDGVILSSTGTGGSIRYFATLGKDGKLSAWLTDMQMGNVVNANIDHISNNLGYSGTVMLVCYKDGTVIGVDYASGVEVCNTTPTTFTSYVSRTVKSFLSPNAYSSVLMGTGNYQDSEREQEKDENNLTTLLDKLELGASDLVGTGSSEEGDSESGAGGSSEADGTAAEGGDGASSDGASSADGTSTKEGDGGEEDGTSEADGTATEGGDGGEDEEQSGTSEADGTSKEDGAGGGDGADGTSDMSGIATGGGDGAEEEAAEGSEAEPAKPENQGTEGEENAGEESLQDIFGASVLVYSPEKGAYVAMETNSLAAGIPETLTKVIARGESLLNPNRESDILGADDPDKDLDIAHGIGRGLYSEEKQGFLLLGVSAVVATVMLAAIGRLAASRKRRK